MTELLPKGVPADVPGGTGTTGRAAVIATVTSRSAVSPAALRRLPAQVTGLEIRADHTGDIDPAALRRHFSGTLVYVLRSAAHGGRDTLDTARRQARLRAAARDYDVVDLEAGHDLVPELLAALPPAARRISWHGDPASAAELRDRFDQLARVPAGQYVLTVIASSGEAALAPLRLLRQVGRDDVTGFGTGPAGTWSRVLAPWLGAPVVYGQAGDDGPADDGTPALGPLLRDYPLPALPPLRGLCGLVGQSNTSLWVRLLNTAFADHAVPYLFLPFAVADLTCFHTGFWPGLAAGQLDELGTPLRGLTIARPYKEAAAQVADLASPAVLAAGAANLVVRRDGHWWADTTDGSATLAALRGAGIPVAGRAVAVVGCGGAGRAAAAGLAAAGATVTLVNRGTDRGRWAARRLGLEFVPLRSFDPGRYAVVAHATPALDEPPFDVDRLAVSAAVVDFVVAAEPTALVTAARRRGLRTIDGPQLLATELAEQFRQMTGRPLPGDPPLGR